MATQLLEKTDKLPQELVCRHYWILESPTGATSTGVCRYCRKVRSFQNAVGDVVWEEERAADITYWGVGEMAKLLEYEAAAR